MACLGAVKDPRVLLCRVSCVVCRESSLVSVWKKMTPALALAPKFAVMDLHLLYTC